MQSQQQQKQQQHQQQQQHQSFNNQHLIFTSDKQRLDIRPIRQKYSVQNTIHNHFQQQYQQQCQIENAQLQNQYQPYNTQQQKQPYKLFSKKSLIKLKQNLNHSKNIIQTNHQIYTVYFPYQPYSVQKKYMEKVLQSLDKNKNAILQSPTGTGKTLCLLTSTVSWLKQSIFSYNNLVQKINQQIKQIKQTKQRNLLYDIKKKQLSNQRCRIIYLSRTHQQLSQVQKELQGTKYLVNSIIFGSRKQLCINKKLNHLSGDKLNHECEKAVRLKKYHKRANGDPKKKQLTPQQIKQFCQFDYKQNFSDKHLNQSLNIQKLKKIGIKQQFCPYYYPYSMDDVHIIFMTYNYVLNSFMMRQFSKYIRNSIIIFDEGHNVPNVSSNGRHLILDCKLFQQTKNQLNEVDKYGKFLQMQAALVIQNEGLINSIKYSVIDLQKSMYSLIQNLLKVRNFNQKQKEYYYQVFPPSSLLNIFYFIVHPQKQQEIRSNLQIKLSQYQIVKDISKYFNNKFGPESNLFQLIQALKHVVDQKSQYLKNLYKIINRIKWMLIRFIQSTQWQEKDLNHYVLLLKIKKNPFTNKVTDFIFQFACNSPAITFQFIAQNLKPKNIIITSGTLKPVEAWTQQLGIPFQVSLQNNHVIQNFQLQINIVKNSIMNPIRKIQSPLNFSYQNLQKMNYLTPYLYQNLYLTIDQLLSIIPNGVLLIFPNKSSFKKIMQFFAKNQFTNKSKHKKKIIFQDDKRAISQTLQEYKKEAITEKGAVLACVCRGRISQGTDLPQQLCRAVIFVGVPNVDVSDPKIKQKKIYLTDISTSINRISKNIFSSRKHLSYSKWYNLQTMRAVNQAIGRVIRNKKDYGMIFLLDDRYTRFKQDFSKWTQNCIKTYHDFKDLYRDAKQFYAITQKLIQLDETQRQKFLNQIKINKAVQNYNIKIENSIKQVPDSKTQLQIEKNNDKQKQIAIKSQGYEDYSKKLKGYQIAITGQFKVLQKQKLIKLINSLGGNYNSNVILKTTCLFAGSSCGNWASNKDIKSTTKYQQSVKKNLQIVHDNQIDNFFMKKIGKNVKEILKLLQESNNESVQQKIRKFIKKQ